MKEKTPASFEQLIRELEVGLFPELEKDDTFTPEEPSKGYFGFTPSHHIRMGLVTKTMVDRLKRPQQYLLSVGCGQAYLERLLVELRVDSGRIILSDASRKNIPNGFEFYEFDMHKEWPSFGMNFDYIIYPESLCSLVKYEPEELCKRMVHIFSNSLINTKSDGEVRFDGHADYKEYFNSAIDIVRKEYPNAKLYYRGNLMVVKRGSEPAPK